MTTLSTSQQDAITKFKKFLKDPSINEMALEGRAGTGKTFLTNKIVEMVKHINDTSEVISGKIKIDLHLTATTNKAVSVLHKLSGGSYKTKTIHSLLDLKVINDYKTGKTKLIPKKNKGISFHKNSLIIIDEASMIDDNLLKEIRKSCLNTKILYILDPYQLAPIGSTNVPVSESVSYKSELIHILRQTGQDANDIINLAEKFRQVLDGKPFPNINNYLNKTNLKRVGKQKFLDSIDKAFDPSTYTPDKARVLSWTNAAVHLANSHVRRLHTSNEIYQPGEYVVTNKPIIERGKIKYKTDDTIQVSASYPGKISSDYNNPFPSYGIEFHGSSYIYHCPKDPNDLKKELKKQYGLAKAPKDFTKYFFIKDMFLDIRPGYASTIHKSQGSTFDTVFINLSDISKNQNLHEIARLMYVAITRASKNVIFYGNLGERCNDA